IAVDTVDVERRIVDALVAAEFDERLHARINLVCEPAEGAILVESAPVEIALRSVGQQSVRIHRTVEGAFEREREAAELLDAAERRADCGFDRQFREAGLNVRAAR